MIKEKAEIEKEKLIAWAKGYIQCLKDYGIWNNGTQTIGCLSRPIKEIIAEVAKSVGLKPEDL